jgi:class 3 adenylate cyclase
VAGSAQDVTGNLEQGRAAFARHDWPAAIESLSTADRDGELAGEDLDRLGTALWWAGRPDESNDALERAFNAFESAGQSSQAAWAAMSLAYNTFRGLNGPVGGGWLARAGRILAELPEGPVHARYGVFRTVEALQSGRLEEGVELADAAIELAQRHAEPSTLAIATSFKGIGLLFSGRWKEGFRYIDEAAAALASGQLDLRVASDIYCNTIAACRNVGDFARAGQWCDEGERWMRRNGAGGYPGVCRVHRAELKMLHGQWPEAEQEARQASEELERFHLLDGVGHAQYQVGEVRRRMGDLDGAAEAFDRAYEHGHDAQPGLALLQLERGEIEEARRSLGRALAGTVTVGSGVKPGPKDNATRARLLPAQVELAIATNDLEAARVAVEELESIAEDFDRPVFEAGALTARGELLLGEQKAAEASPLLGRSWRLWQTTDLPYEAALARLHYAEALAAEGDEATAKRDIRAARSVLERLGATREVQRADRLLGEDAGRDAGRSGAKAATKVSRTFMFTDIVTSTDLVAAMGDDAWLELLRWHARELRDAIDKHAGVVVSDTGDGYFAAFERPGDAIEAAVDIQRRLARHRRDHGFAPSVRIGLHTAEAIREGGNYRGSGVHVAARIGAAAGREEILASESVIAGTGKFQLSAPRTIELKGVKEPVAVREVAWR